MYFKVYENTSTLLDVTLMMYIVIFISTIFLILLNSFKQLTVPLSEALIFRLLLPLLCLLLCTAGMCSFLHCIYF